MSHQFGIGFRTGFRMSRVVLFNKPFRVIFQFRESGDKPTLGHYFSDPALRVAGRLDYDSEGLLILTDDGRKAQKIMNPRFKLQKIYWVQVEGELTDEALEQLRNGVDLKDGLTRPAKAISIEQPISLWQREPPHSNPGFDCNQLAGVNDFRRPQPTSATHDCCGKFPYIAVDTGPRR